LSSLVVLILTALVQGGEACSCSEFDSLRHHMCHETELYAVKVRSMWIEIARTPSPPPADKTYQEQRKGFGSGDVRVYEMQIGAAIRHFGHPLEGFIEVESVFEDSLCGAVLETSDSDILVVGLTRHGRDNRPSITNCNVRLSWEAFKGTDMYQEAREGGILCTPDMFNKEETQDPRCPVAGMIYNECADHPSYCGLKPDPNARKGCNMACECPPDKPMTETDGSCVAEEDCAVHPSFIALLNQGLQEMYGVTLEDGGDMDCIDQDENCRHWTTSIEGVCQTDEYVKRSCERSCRTCEERPLTCSDVQRMLNRGRQGFGGMYVGCTSDGNFERRQCIGSICWCIKPDGNPLDNMAHGRDYTTACDDM